KYYDQRKGPGPIVRGVGMAMIMQATGIPGVDMGSARIKMNEDGSFDLHYGATDLGTGADTVLCQMAAETLGVTVDDIVEHPADTDNTPFDTGAYASSTTYISGGAVTEACKKVRRQILERAAKMLDEPKDNLRIGNKKVVSNETGNDVSYGDICRDALYVSDQRQIQGDGSFMSYESPPPFGAHFARVAVDTGTGEIDVERYVAATDCGLPINPQACHGQVEGAIQQGLGYALTEEMTFNDRGQMVNPNFQDYKIHTSRDMPEIESILVKTHEPEGPFGVKAIAEIPINGPAPTVANAVYDATGVRIKNLPVTPEKLHRKLHPSKYSDDS
ncbi:MAG: xanthine dehydrogenase family protein molybdopterin-binding subunit, partial [bacterium]